ncbi:TonB family protein [uncultured Roseovarius sp.]|uniref:TonB family protein n=1 Tax=uncultured Roseovarius sp. TaxID=293344 RepID=UPI002604759B|nr:TonB family protein [uncultured Roseovarius sp.]
MTHSSRLAKTLAVSVAIALHSVAIWGMAKDTNVAIEGSAGSIDASIGSSFADMSAGMFIATQTNEVLEEISPEKIEAVLPSETFQPAPPDSMAKIKELVTTQTASIPEPTRTTEPPLPTQHLLPEQAQAVAEPIPDLAASEITEMIEPEVDETPSVTRSLRPKTRSTELEKRVEPPKKVAKTKRQKAKSQPRGNAKQNATIGAETGRTETKAKVASTGKSKRQATGNVAVSNYPGKVMKKISRVPKPRVGSKGTSVVAFTISSSGGIGAISLSRSSGSSKLDQAALRVVRRAAPFPPPPTGARRSFSIKIKGG